MSPGLGSGICPLNFGKKNAIIIIIIIITSITITTIIITMTVQYPFAPTMFADVWGLLPGLWNQKTLEEQISGVDLGVP